MEPLDITCPVCDREPTRCLCDGPVKSTKKEWREEDAASRNERLAVELEGAYGPFGFPLNDVVTTVPEPEAHAKPFHPGTFKIEEQAYVNEAISKAVKSDGGSTDYYKVPLDAKDLQDLIEFKRMEFGLANIFKACYRFGDKDGTSKRYDLNKMIFFAKRELARLDKEEAL